MRCSEAARDGTFVLNLRGSQIRLPCKSELQMSAIGAAKPTSLKLPAVLKSQLEDVAKSSGLSLHAYMIQTLADSVQRARMREAFALDSMNALRDMKARGLGHELGDVRSYFSKLAGHRKGLHPKPPPLRPKRVG